MGSPVGARLLMCSDGVSGCITALAMARWIARRLIGKFSSYSAGQNTFREEAIGFQSFVVNFAESGNAVVPFEKGSGVANALNGAIVQFPNRVDDRMIVSIENIFFVFGMASDVNLGDAFGGDAVYIFEGVETVVLR